MSTSYNLEPNPTAKVIFKTTTGDLLLELFAKQTPIASRNFLQLCLDGYYDNTIFHRLVPDFIIQGGDPTGTGSGGQSSHDGGAPFEDEFHSRLRFNRRGLLGMANSGSKNDNGSQFFLTLGKAEELNGKNTMFGRIEGNTIYNLMKMGEAELVEGEDSERPLYPTRVTGTEVLVNPFEDMINRTLVARKQEPRQSKVGKRPKKKSGKQMLSFGGGDEDEDEATVPSMPKFNPKLVRAGPPARRPLPQPTDAIEESRLPVEKSPSKLETEYEMRPRASAPAKSISISESSSSPEPEIDRQAAKLAKTNAQISELKQSLRRETSMPEQREAKRQKTTLETLIPAGATRGVRRAKAGGREEQRNLDAFTAFQSRLGAAGGHDTPAANDSSGRHEFRDSPKGQLDPPSDARSNMNNAGEDVCDLHFVPNCQSCKRWEQVEDEQNDDDLTAEGFMGHTLSFAKDRLGKNLEWKRQNEKELVVIDPREREKEILGTKKSKLKTQR